MYRTVILLFFSNVFMTAAWYGHLKLKGLSLWQAILLGWGLAFFEYMLQVPANRLGYFHHMTVYQLKILQECITLAVFSLFTYFVFDEKPTLRTTTAFILIVAAVCVTFCGRQINFHE